MATLYLCPEDLRFTQKSIKNSFNEARGYQRIDDAVDQIGSKQLSPQVFMPLHVVLHRGVLWSLESRRLWVLRKAEVPAVRVIVRLPTYNRRMESFFARLTDPQLERRYSSANYFPVVRGGVRSVGIDRSAAPPPPIPLQLNHQTTFAGPGEANRTPPPPQPQPRPLTDIRVRSNNPLLVFPLPNASHQIPKNPGPCGKKGSDPLWERILNVVDWVMNPCKEKFVIVLVLCFLLRQTYSVWKGDVNGKHIEFCNTITVNEGGKNVFRRGSHENVVSDQNNHNRGFAGYLGVIALKGVAGLGKIVSRLFVSVFCFVLRQACNLLKILAVTGTVVMGKILSTMFCFLRFFVRNAVDLIKEVAVGSGRKALDAFGVIWSQCFSHLHFVVGQIVARFGTMGIRISEFCLEKFWELLQFIKCQAFGIPGEIIVWSQVKMQDAVGFYLKEFLRKVVWSAGLVVSC